MQPIKSLLVLGVLAVPAFAPTTASAQPNGYYANPPPNSQLAGGFHNRQGRLIFGFSLGLGGMSDRGGDITCSGCDYNPLSGEVSGHIGGFIGPRFALMGEAQANIQTIASDAFTDTTLVQSALMIAGQYCLTPQLWIKGGLGFANLQLQQADEFGVFAESKPDNGTAIMGAAGFELFSSRYLSVDLQGRLLNGSYKGLDNNITAASIGIGVNWF
jgi:hypothetical protein